MADHALSARIDEWLAADPDPTTRAELESLVAAGDAAALDDRFGARLVFGTAGIRGAQGAGPNRMNRVTVRRMVAGVAAHLGPGATVVIGYDARHNSDVFARDAADVLAAAGITALLIDGHVPTPVLAFAVPRHRADLGLMVTASHNPPADNGCKVFLADGAQLRSPVDTEIEAAIGAVPLPPRVLPPPSGGSVRSLGSEVVDAYVEAIADAVPVPDAGAVRAAYTPLHGVGRPVFEAVFTAAGLPVPVSVPSQADPDPDFPTVSFPNPEEPGAMDAVVALAQRDRCHLAIANDPDADRLAVAVPLADGTWRTLTGDEVGALILDAVLAATSGPDRKVVSTVVCSSLVATMAAAHGLQHRETLTGFKWIMAEAYADPASTPVLAYEESLGYAATPIVRDKDGISAALWFMQLTGALMARGATPAGRLDELAVEHGLHATRSTSIRFDGPGAVDQAGAAVDALRAAPPADIGGRRVVEIRDYVAGGTLPPTNLLRIDLEDDIRVLVRPSGTEPKTKLYLEQVIPVPEVIAVEPARRAAWDTLDTVAAEMAAVFAR